MTMQATRKIGNNRGRPRLWLQGAILEAAGFAPGDHYALKVAEGKLRLRLLTKDDQPQPAEEPKQRKVSGKSDMPIVDISGDVIERAFPDGGTVRVKSANGIITARWNDEA